MEITEAITTIREIATEFGEDDLPTEEAVKLEDALSIIEANSGLKNGQPVTDFTDFTGLNVTSRAVRLFTIANAAGVIGEFYVTGLEQAVADELRAVREALKLAEDADNLLRIEGMTLSRDGTGVMFTLSDGYEDGCWATAAECLKLEAFLRKFSERHKVKMPPPAKIPFWRVSALEVDCAINSSDTLLLTANGPDPRGKPQFRLEATERASKNTMTEIALSVETATQLRDKLSEYLDADHS